MDALAPLFAGAAAGAVITFVMIAGALFSISDSLREPVRLQRSSRVTKDAE